MVGLELNNVCQRSSVRKTKRSGSASNATTSHPKKASANYSHLRTRKMHSSVLSAPNTCALNVASWATQTKLRTRIPKEHHTFPAKLRSPSKYRVLKIIQWPMCERTFIDKAGTIAASATRTTSTTTMREWLTASNAACLLARNASVPKVT